MAARQINISFEDRVKSSKTRAVAKHVYDYPAAGRVHNPMWDVPQRLPVYTKTAKSKSWFAAGWYNVRKGRHWHTVLAPKLIVLQRYPYQGPFYSEQQSHDHAPK
jgi:hypothetical protein